MFKAYDAIVENNNLAPPVTIRLRIFLLVLLASLPALGFLAGHLYNHRNDEIEKAKQNLQALAALAARELDESLNAALQLAAGLSRTSEVQRGKPAECSAFLADMLREFPQYTTLSTYTLAGDVQCDGLLSGKRVNIADRKYFRQALAGGTPAVGEPIFGRVTGAGVMPVLYPVRDAAGRPQAFLLASLDLARFTRRFAATQHAYDSVFMLQDRHGMIMARHPDNAAWTGKTFSDSPVTRFILQRREGGTVEAAGADGVPRVWAVAALPETRDTGLRLAIGYPHDQIVAAADRGLLEALATLGGLSLLMLAAAWLLGDAAIGRPAARILAATARFRGGDLAARIGAPYPRGEIGALMRTLDDTAEAIQAQQSKIVELNATLESRVAERTAKVQEQAEELLRKNTQLEAASRLKSEFLANMSHELRTPLNAIIGFSELLRDGLLGALTAEQQKSIGDIYGAGRHLLTLINDVLDLSKIEAGRMTLEPAEVDVRELLDGSLFVVREKALKHGLRLALDAPEKLGEIVADPRKVKQIVFNLLSNAVKFTPDGGRVTLTARRVPASDVARAEAWGRTLPLAGTPAERYLEVAVEDNGPGMAAADLQRLFIPFTQLDSGPTKHFEGTGLGLSLVRRLAELHGGAVAVRSELGKGSTFAVWLPVERPAAGGGSVGGASAPTGEVKGSVGGASAPTGEVKGFVGGASAPTTAVIEAQVGAEAPPTEAPPTEAPPTEAPPTKAPPTKPATAIPSRAALVVEDDAAAAEFIRRVLESEGLKVSLVGTAEAALAWLEQSKPDLVTLDILLPGMDGWEFLQRLEQSPRLRDVPVIVLSIVPDEKRGLALGASAVLQKPVSRAELMEAVGGLGLRRASGKARVLIVDDDQRAVDILAAYLPADEFETIRAYGGREAIALTRSAKPDLILLDLLMPEVSGFDVVRELGGDSATAAIPIIVVTAKLLDAEDRAALNGHVRRIVEKAGLDGRLLLGEARRALGRKGG